jgi:hypothetical protein
MRKSIAEMRPQPPKPTIHDPIIMNSTIAVALLCRGGAPITCDTDVDRLHKARASETTDPVEIERLKLASDQMKRDKDRLFGNVSKVVSIETLWPIKSKPVAKPKPVEMPVETLAAIPVETPVETPAAVPASLGFVSELKQIFAEEFEERPGNCVSFNDLRAVFERCKGSTTEKERKLFRFYCKSVFLAQWKGAKHVVHRNKRSYKNVIEKKKA